VKLKDLDYCAKELNGACFGRKRSVVPTDDELLVMPSTGMAILARD
jgi:hypothetical protein